MITIYPREQEDPMDLNRRVGSGHLPAYKRYAQYKNAVDSHRKQIEQEEANTAPAPDPHFPRPSDLEFQNVDARYEPLCEEDRPRQGSELRQGQSIIGTIKDSNSLQGSSSRSEQTTVVLSKRLKDKIKTLKQARS